MAGFERVVAEGVGHEFLVLWKKGFWRGTRATSLGLSCSGAKIEDDSSAKAASGSFRAPNFAASHSLVHGGEIESRGWSRPRLSVVVLPSGQRTVTSSIGDGERRNDNRALLCDR